MIDDDLFINFIRNFMIFYDLFIDILLIFYDVFYVDFMSKKAVKKGEICSGVLVNKSS